MKKTLAIVLALAMVLCMIPAAFAGSVQTITDKSYIITVDSFGPMASGASAANAHTNGKANSLTFEYNYEEEQDDATGKFTENKKMALVSISGFDAKLESAPSVAVTIDGKDLKVNEKADYYKIIEGALKANWTTNKTVVFPVELTKAGYSDTYLVTVKATVDGVEITETAKISLTFKNKADYKPGKTATISMIESLDESNLDAYIVGSKIYLDYAKASSAAMNPGVKVTFKDDNGAAFTAVTWAYKTTSADCQGQPAIGLDDELKLKDSAAKYWVDPSRCKTGVTFKLETASGIYTTKAYDVVVRTGIVETDPKGIYFAESTKTIKIGESYAPVVMGVATGKKVAATINIGTDATGKITNAIDIVKNKVYGTKEGVAYITATYTYKNGAAAGKTNTYTSSSMKIIVTEGEVAPAEGTATTYYVTCRTLNVRKGAGTSYAKAGKLHRGDKVEVVSISKNWAKLANGTYVSAKYIAK